MDSPSSPHEELRVACVQMRSGAGKEANIARAQELVEEAARAGAKLVLLPEHWNLTGDGASLRASAESRPSGPTLDAMSGWARAAGITLVGGSIIERDEETATLYNTAFVFAPDGRLVGSYRKVHLFDVDVGGRRYRESEVNAGGAELLLVDAGGWRIGISICYDLRFPELYRALADRGADAVVVPAFFTVTTGRDHWNLLLRARAVENQLYVLAAGQCGEPAPGKPAYGRSLICDPWGLVVAQADDEDAVVVATLRRARIDAVRTALPAQAHRRPDLYRAWVAGGDARGEGSPERERGD